MRSVGPCLAHPDSPTAAVCRSCDRRMCADCWEYNLDGEPCCTHCATLARQPISPLVPVGGVAVLLWPLALLARRLPFDAKIRWASLGVAVLLLAPVAWRLTRRSNFHRTGHVVTPRPAEDGGIDARRRHPYRGALHRIGRRIAPPISGRMAALVVAMSLAFTACAIPGVLHLPRWLEVEAVLLAWWLLGAITLSVLLYRRARIADDLRSSVGDPPSVPRTTTRLESSSGDPTYLDPTGDPTACLDLDGLLGGLALIVAVLIGWLLVDFVVPALLLAAGTLLLGALRRVAHDDHQCEGRAARAAFWGALWATAYTLPLAALVFLVHLVVAR